MCADQQTQRPEGKLISEALKEKGVPVRQAAPLAGMTEARWRQIVKGSMTVSGVVADVTAPAVTLARMAQVAGVSPEALAGIGREDAAQHLRRLSDDGGLTDSVDVHVADQADEIDLIYASSMTATEKLAAIRKVLTLRAQAEQETPKRRGGRS